MEPLGVLVDGGSRQDATLVDIYKINSPPKQGTFKTFLLSQAREGTPVQVHLLQPHEPGGEEHHPHEEDGQRFPHLCAPRPHEDPGRHQLRLCQVLCQAEAEGVQAETVAVFYCFTVTDREFTDGAVDQKGAETIDSLQIRFLQSLLLN